MADADNFSKAYLDDKKVEVWGGPGAWTIYIESATWGTVSADGKTMAEAIANLLGQMDAKE